MIPLYRNQKNVLNFIQAVGRFKETELTAYLGYLIAIFPKFFASLLFQHGEKGINVFIENAEEATDRYDILISTNKRILIIEAKLAFDQNEKQVMRYLQNAKKKYGKNITLILLDQGAYRSKTWLRSLQKSKRFISNIDFISWSDCVKVLRRIEKSTHEKKVNPEGYYVARAFKNYLEENAMSNKFSKEIYVRDMSGESIELFFKYHIYKCQKQFYNSAQGNLYFAPYFTGRAPKDFAEHSLVRIEKGISWAARAKDVQVVKRTEVKDYLKSKDHPKWRETASEILKQTKDAEILLMPLEAPFQLFLAPVSKKQLNVHGAMGSRSFTFDTLFNSAGKVV